MTGLRLLVCNTCACFCNFSISLLIGSIKDSSFLPSSSTSCKISNNLSSVSLLLGFLSFESKPSCIVSSLASVSSKFEETFKTLDVTFTPRASAQITVYPNPMKDEVKVRFIAPKRGNATLRIYSEYGHEIYNMSMQIIHDENTFQFNSSSIENGIYFLKSNEATFKIIKI